MITINLKPGVRRAKSKKSSLAGGLSSLKALPSMVKDPWPLAAVGAWVILVGGLGWLVLSSAASLRSLGPELEKARSENRRYRAFATEKKKAEAARDSVLVQIATIRQVDGDRYVWPHILDEVTRALPDYTWLTAMGSIAIPPPVNPDPAAAAAAARSPVGVQMVGRTMDIQGFTRFMRQLEDSPWLRDVTVLSTETIIQRGRAVTGFTVRAGYDRGGQAGGRAAPSAGGN
ncbi:MAG TPA: PilN domain-containing protein [Gemmatimonadales bacterium]|jgi:Tfp pilus assembly protein PilN|nr:PilN domain-containing protein [Gemmatimonadales bacterium]